MPIPPDLRVFYGREWRTVVRPRILARARNRCEQCGKPDRAEVWVWRSGSSGQYWTASLTVQNWTYCLAGASGSFRLFDRDIRRDRQSGRLRRIRVILTVAHLDHTPGHDDDDNLRALCQWCHLHLDALQHRDTRAARKDRGRPLLAAAGAES
jgi:hypothetical protein